MQHILNKTMIKLKRNVLTGCDRNQLRGLTARIDCLISVVDQLLNGVEALPFGGYVEWLENVRKRCVQSTDPKDRRLQMQEAFALNCSCDLGAETRGHGRLVSNQKSAGLLHRVHNGILVPGQKRLKIDQFAAYVQLFLCHSTDLAQYVHLRSPGQQRHIVTFFDHLRL